MTRDESKVVMIIQARMGSTRLPGKSMFDLAGAPLVGRILERVKRCRLVDEIVLAIPDSSENDELQQLADVYEVMVFRGDEHNVLLRYCGACLEFNANFVVRLPADNPVPEPSEIDRIIAYHLDLARPGFSTNLAQIMGSGYPDGIGAEVFDANLLLEALHRGPTLAQQEHVHLNFFDYESDLPVDDHWCPIGYVECPEEFRRPDVILDVNTNQQYEFMKELYNALYPANPLFGIVDILNWMDSK